MTDNIDPTDIDPHSFQCGAPLSATEIIELKRLEAAATPGPWYVTGINLSALVRNAKAEIVATRHRAGSHDNEHDMAIIAAARNALPRLLEMVERLQGQLRVTSVGAVKAEEMLMDSLTVIEGTDAEVFRQRDEIIDLRHQLAERGAEIERLKCALMEINTGEMIVDDEDQGEPVSQWMGIEDAMRIAGEALEEKPSVIQEPLCEDEGCPHNDIQHICVAREPKP